MERRARRDSVYLRVANELRERIYQGEGVYGFVLPPIGQLAREFGVAAMTVHKAVRTLKEENLVTSRQGDRTWVVQPSPELNHELIAGFWPTVSTLGFLLRTRTVVFNNDLSRNPSGESFEAYYQAMREEARFDAAIEPLRRVIDPERRSEVVGTEYRQIPEIKRSFDPYLKVIEARRKTSTS